MFQLRATAEWLAQVAEDAIRFFADHGRQDFLWFLGSRSTPRSDVDLLTWLSATILGDCAAMLLEDEPPPEPGADIRLVTTPQQLLAYRQIGAAAEVAGEVSNDQHVQIKAGNDTAWQDSTESRLAQPDCCSPITKLQFFAARRLSPSPAVAAPIPSPRTHPMDRCPETESWTPRGSSFDHVRPDARPSRLHQSVRRDLAQTTDRPPEPPARRSAARAI
jgi:hypothetical protein